MPDDDQSPLSALDAKRLFADWKRAPAIVIAVSGGPDSVALMWLMARWCRALSRAPRLVAVTVDHGLRKQAAREAREVKHLAQMLELPHRTMRWTGVKPRTGLPAAARAERYRLLAKVALMTRAARAKISVSRSSSNIIRSTRQLPSAPSCSRGLPAALAASMLITAGLGSQSTWTSSVASSAR